MRSFCIGLIGFFIASNGFSQINADSLGTVLKKEKTDTATLARYMEQLDKLSTDNMAAGLVLGDWIAEHAVARQAHILYAKSQLAIAVFYHYTNDFSTATKYYVEVQTFAQKHGLDELYIHAINNLANIYYQNSQFEKAEEMYLKVIEGCKKLDIKVGIAASYGSLGTLYFSASVNDSSKKRKGIAYMMMSSEVSTGIPDTVQLIRSYSGISNMYCGLGMYDSAMYWVLRSGDLIKARQNNDEGYPYHYYHKGTALLGKKEYKAAIESFLTGLPYTKKYSTPLWESSHYQGLSKAYTATGDYKKALEYGEKHFKIEDSVLNAENFAKAADIQNKYEREKKDKELLQKDLQLKTASERRTRLTFLLISSLVVLALLGIFAALLLKNIRARKKAYHQLEEKSIKIQEQAVELSKQARLIAKFQSQMNPHFVFNALHNIQGLVISAENKKATSQIQSLAQLMRKTFANAEKDDIPLEEEINYLQKYIEFERSAFDNKLEFDVQTEGEMENVLIPPMMIQPFVENAIKHAELKKIENPYIKVLIEIENNLLSISIRDNGIGLQKEKMAPDMLSHSMSVIKTRIQLLFQEKSKPVDENIFTVKTVPDVATGTMVKFYLPLNYTY